MNTWWVITIGFSAQFLFSSRLILQWVLSEKHQRILTPTLFWKLSLVASFLLFVYGYFRYDFSIMLGQILTYYIYIRNMQLQREWQKLPYPVRIGIIIFPIVILVYGYNNGVYDRELLFRHNSISKSLFVWGILAQVIFTFRFVYQWWYSEKSKESLLPLGFWILSLIGGGMILIYAGFRKDIVLLVGHGAGVAIYIRNLILYRRSQHE